MRERESVCERVCVRESACVRGIEIEIRRAPASQTCQRERARVLDVSRVQDSGVESVISGVWGFGNGVQQSGFTCLLLSVECSGVWVLRCSGLGFQVTVLKTL